MLDFIVGLYNQYTLLIQYTLVFSSVLTLVALGGCFSEHSGVINIGLEGIMIIGALGGALALHYMPADTSAALVLLLTVLASVTAGMLYSLLLAVASINLKADQTLVGTAMNMLGVALSTVIVKFINISESTRAIEAARLAGETLPSIDNTSQMYYGGIKNSLLIVQNTEFSWFVVIALAAVVFAYITLYKTRFGLRLMACGEHPQAADSVGVNVSKMRYAGVLISGALGGLGGVVYITAGVSLWKFELGVMGFGFLSLAVMIFGQWKPLRILLAALLFGLFRALSNVYTGIGFLNELQIPGPVYNMTPYIISLVVLALTSKKSRAPKAEGIPYDKGSR